MDLQQRMAELDARIAARMSALNARTGVSQPTEGPATPTNSEIGDSVPVPSSPTTAPETASASAPDTRLRGLRLGSVCGIASTLLVGFPTRSARRLRASRGTTSSGSGWLLPVHLMFLCAVLGFVWKQYPIDLLGVVTLGVLAIPIEALWVFQALDDGSLGRGRLYRYVFEGIYIAILSASMFGCLLQSGVCGSWGPGCRALAEECVKIIVLIFVFTGASDHAPRENGLLAGAAFGAGFMSFSAAQCAVMLFQTPPGTGFFAFARFLPFGHVAETAILGAALAGLLGFGPPMRRTPAVLLILAAVGIHMLWVIDFGLPWFARYLVLDFLSWLIALSLFAHRLFFHPELLAVVEAEPRSGAHARAGNLAFESFRGFVGFVIITFLTGFILTAGGLFFNRVIAPRIGL